MKFWLFILESFYRPRIYLLFNKSKHKCNSHLQYRPTLSCTYKASYEYGNDAICSDKMCNFNADIKYEIFTYCIQELNALFGQNFLCRHPNVISSDLFISCCIVTSIWHIAYISQWFINKKLKIKYFTTIPHRNSNVLKKNLKYLFYYFAEQGLVSSLTPKNELSNSSQFTSSNVLLP